MEIIIETRIRLSGAPDGFATVCSVTGDSLNPRGLSLARVGNEADTGIDAFLEVWSGAKRLGGAGEGYIVKQCRYIRDAAADRRWSDLEQATPDGIQVHLEARRKAGDSVKYLQHRHGALRSFFKLAAKRGLINENPTDSVPKPERPHKAPERYTPTEDEVRRLILAANQDWRKKDRWLVYLTMAFCGLRPKTLRGLERKHVVLDAEYPHFKIPARLLKKGEPATVYMPAEVARWLREAFAFWDGSSRAFQSVGDSNNFDRDHAAAGLHKHPDRDCLSFSAYSLRHFCITALRYRETLSTEDLAAHATHNSPKMTLSVYTHAQHPSRAKKIFALEPLLPSDFVPGWGRKKTGLAVKPLATWVDGKYADAATFEAPCDESQPRQSDPSRSPQGANVAVRLSREPGRVSLPSERRAVGGPMKKAPSCDEALSSRIGVGGFEPPTPFGNDQVDDLVLLVQVQARLLARLLHRGAVDGCVHGSPDNHAVRPEKDGQVHRAC